MKEENANDPPGGTSLAGGADKKWDGSRQKRTKWINPDVLISPNFSQPAPSNNPNYPTNDVEGNDDASTNEETNDPYNDDGKLIGYDPPGFGIAHSAGFEGDIFDWRFHAREFARLEIEGTWYRISDFFLWRIHIKFKRVNEKWVNNGTNQALNNTGF